MSITGKRKVIPIGVEDFKEIISKNGYFVDKTLMIQKLIENGTKVTLFTRPRRFGKTLNQSMLRRFFEDERTEQGERIDNGHLFDGLAVSRCGEVVLKHQQQYPVISLRLDTGIPSRFDSACERLKEQIRKEYRRHSYVLQGDALGAQEKERFQSIANHTDGDKIAPDILYFLCECLAGYHGRNVIILVDDYDVAMENACKQGFYEEMSRLLCALLESVFKTNPYLEKGVITGRIGISKECVYTGLLNIAVDSVLHTGYRDSFGFTEAEAVAMAEYFGLTGDFLEMKEWYGGYRFGEAEIYGPWSVSKYINDCRNRNSPFPQTYWTNTFSENILRDMVENADNETKNDMETLLNNGAIEKQMHRDITYEDLHQSREHLWNFLLFAGYLRKTGERMIGHQRYMSMEIPNKEIKKLYADPIRYLNERKIKEIDKSPLIAALDAGDCRAAEAFISTQLMNTICSFSRGKMFYCDFMDKLLTNAGKYLVESNREKGLGRPDIVLCTKNIRGGSVMILELKTATGVADMEKACDAGLVQIEEQQYAEPFIEEGYPEVKKYALSFYKKECMVKRSLAFYPAP